MRRINLIIILLMISGIATFAEADRGSIKGKVVDKTSQEPLPGVNILILEKNIGAVTDNNGEFIINGIDAGMYQLRASYVGYNSVIKTDVNVNNARPAYIFFEMSESVIQLEGITVKSDYFELNPDEINSVANFSYEEIRRAPGGFEDVVRALSVLPGVAQASAGRNDLVVRGGAPSENLYLVDGFIIPNINHFGNQGATGGPLSFINLDYVSETTFSSGGFSAMYGDKLSSVLKIDLREGREDRLGGKATISATQFGLNLEGPVSEKSNFIFSLRRSYLDFIFNAAGFNFVPEYYDLFSKYTYNIDAKNKISFLFIGALDRVKFNNNNSDDLYENSRILGSDQNQYFTGISYRKLFNNGFYNITLGRTFVDYDSAQRDTLLNPIFLNKSREQENELKGDAVYKLSSKSEINFGASVKYIKFNADIKLPIFLTPFGDTLNITSLSTKENFWKSNLFAQYSNMMWDRLHFNLGVRGDYFSGINNKYYLSPRFSAAYRWNDAAGVNLSAGIYYQSPSYIWLAADNLNKNLKAVKVDQLILGYERKLREDTRIKLEAFYKKYSNYPASVLRPYLVLANTGAGFGGGDENFSSLGLEKLTSAGKGNVKGIEFSLQKKASEIPLYGILSITFSEAKFTGLDGVERTGAYDQKWIINLSAGYMFNTEWEAAFKFRFASGNPYTPFNSDGTQSVANYNSVRFEPLHAIDIRIDKRWPLEKFELITYVDIQNIYNNKNSNTIRWDYRTGEIDKQSSIGLLPSIGVSLEF